MHDEDKEIVERVVEVLIGGGTDPFDLAEYLREVADELEDYDWDDDEC